jgi:outer membrane protein assembly factor BamB
VVTIGSIGLIQCVDAANGKRLWEFKTKFYEANLATKQKTIASKSMAKWNDPRCSPTFAAGYFIVRDNANLIALEAATGKPVWEVTVGGIPVRWVHAGKEYLLSRTSCIDPKMGKILWTADSAVHADKAVAVAGDMVLFSGGKTKGGATVGLQGYRISPERAEKVWEVDAKMISAWGSDTACILNGHAYANASCEDLGGRSIVCIEMATGKIVGRIRAHNDSCGSLVGADDHVFFDGLWIKADPKDFRIDVSTSETADKKLWGGSNSDYCRAASSTPCIADGRLYIRGQRSIFCFDMRKR